MYSSTDPNVRIAPAFDYSDRIGEEPRHVVTASRLREIRDQKMYPFFDQGGNDGNGDFQMNVRSVRRPIRIHCRLLIGQPFVPENVCPITSFPYTVVLHPISVINIM